MNKLTTSLLALAIGIGLGACGKGPASEAKDAKDAKPAGASAAEGKTARGNPSAAAVLQVAPEDLHTVGRAPWTSGPSITGSLQPERRADLRAELQGVVLQVLKENGDLVRRGDLLVRIDDSAIRESMLAADAGVRAATQAFDQATRQYERTSTLKKSGMVSNAALDDAETRKNNAQSDLEAARTRAAQARQQLTRTEVRAPFDGVITDRRVSAGDTAQIGKELLKVIDPASMRFEGLISADHVGQVKAGQTVRFRVNGFGEREFEGRIRRVNPSANAATRQVEVLVDVLDKKQMFLAGLYAEGQVESATQDTLTVPAAALLREGDRTSVWQVAGGSLKRVDIKVGPRDARSGDFPVLEGLNGGDRLLRYPAGHLKDGQRVEMASAPKPEAGAPATVKTTATTTAAK
jgi:RND family efflux transporter MFP subunit